jgi:hypothetical protein
MFLILATILVLFAVTEAIMDVCLAALMSNAELLAIDGGTPDQLLAKWQSLYTGRKAVAVTNK